MELDNVHKPQFQSRKQCCGEDVRVDDWVYELTDHSSSSSSHLFLDVPIMPNGGGCIATEAAGGDLLSFRPGCPPDTEPSAECKNSLNMRRTVHIISQSYTRLFTWKVTEILCKEG